MGASKRTKLIDAFITFDRKNVAFTARLTQNLGRWAALAALYWKQTQSVEASKMWYDRLDMKESFSTVKTVKRVDVSIHCETTYAEEYSFNEIDVEYRIDNCNSPLLFRTHRVAGWLSVDVCAPKKKRSGGPLVFGSEDIPRKQYWRQPCWWITPQCEAPAREVLISSPVDGTAAAESGNIDAATFDVKFYNRHKIMILHLVFLTQVTQCDGRNSIRAVVVLSRCGCRVRGR